MFAANCYTQLQQSIDGTDRHCTVCELHRCFHTPCERETAEMVKQNVRKSLTVFESSLPDSMIFRQSGIISVVSRKFITSCSSVYKQFVYTQNCIQRTTPDYYHLKTSIKTRNSNVKELSSSQKNQVTMLFYLKNAMKLILESDYMKNTQCSIE